MDISKANIEPLKDSIIDHKVRFSTSVCTARELLDFRKNNMKCTQMCWITLKPIIDSGNSLYNPRTLIMNILN